MKQERILSFGKYKGQEVKYIILTHIGYIMWCFENLQWFELTEEEQALYDALAIMIKKEDLQMTFPVETMYKHVKNREALDKLETPFFLNGRHTACRAEVKENPICKSVEKYASRSVTHSSANTANIATGILHSMNKEIDSARLDMDSDEDIFGGLDDISNC